MSLYVLLDPRDDSIRYVGRAKRPERRNHGYRVEGQKLLDWLDALRKQKLKPRMMIVGVVDQDVAATVEKMAIFIAQGCGCELVNTQNVRRNPKS